MGGIFSREENEEKLVKKTVVGNKLKYAHYITYGLLCGVAALSAIFSFGAILLIDGGITVSYLIISFSMAINEKLTKKYLKNLSDITKRNFSNDIHNFYENTINPSINDIEILVQDFINDENVTQKTIDKFDENRSKFINESNQIKRHNILVIGPTGSGKSTLINEFLHLEKKAKEGKGDVQTMDFKEYFTKKSPYCLIDSQGFDYSKSIEEFSKDLQSKIKEYNKLTYKFIDMIYYCTDNLNRFQIQEYKLIKELKKVFNLEKVPLIIVFTQCYFKNDFIEMKNFINEKYNEEELTCIGILAKDKESIKAYGLDDLKALTEKKLNNFKENAYAGKFIANISKILYKDYKSWFIGSFIKGFFWQNKDESIEKLFHKIFNMYRFENNDLSCIYKKRIREIKDKLIKDYESNLNNLLDKIMDLNACSSIIEEKKLDKNEDLSNENFILKENRKKELKETQFDSFKNDTDSIVFPCCLDILKIEIIKTFNGHIIDFLQPKIKELMATIHKP